FAHVRRRWRGRPWIHAASAAIIVAIAMEPLAAPIGYVRYDGVPRIYDTIAREPGVVTMELPLPMPRGAFFNAAYLINSTRHWKPMVNGYSGFVPDSYVEHYNQLHTFPAPETIAVLQRLGVTHAFVHRDVLGAEKSADLDPRGGRIRLAAEGDIALYQVAPASAHK